MDAVLVDGGVVANISKFSGEIPAGWVESPGGVGVGYLDNGDGTFSAPASSPAPSTPKDIRDTSLSKLAHDFGDGRVIQCRPYPFTDESNMRNAIEKMARSGKADRYWLSSDNTPILVTSADLLAAIESGQDQGDAVWEEYFLSISS